VRHLVSQIERLTPFPDVFRALGDMCRHGVKLVILSNGDSDMLAACVPFSGTQDLWDKGDIRERG
jgi:2-haloacid dehalogenase